MTKKRTFKSSTPPLRKGFRRSTHYLTEDLIKRLKIQAAKESRDASSVLRDILDKNLAPYV